MIVEAPLISTVDVQTPDFAAMGFVLGISKLGDSLGSGATTEAWLTHIADTVEITVSRGARRTGLGLSTDVGLTTVSFYDYQDPMDGGTLQPGQALRIMAEGAPIFTGRIADISSGYRRVRGSSQLKPFVEVIAADAVSVHSTSMRFGARPPLGFETFEQRIHRLAASTTAPLNAPPLGTPVEPTSPLELTSAVSQRLQGTVYESTVANHFDLACNSVGAAWYVDREGITQFRLPGAAGPVVAVFSDVRDVDNVEYGEISAGYDTQSLLNRLVAVNRGLGVDGLAEDISITVSNARSESRWGTREQSIDTNLYGVAPYAGSLQHRLEELLSDFEDPTLLVSSVRWNAAQNLALAGELEVCDRVEVEFNGLTQPSEVIAIQHIITPTRWMINLDLIPE